MKFLIKLVIVIPMVFLIVGCNKKTYNEINFNQFEKMIEEKESFVLVIGSSTCSHCAEYEKTMKKIINEYNLDIKYINLNNLTSKEKSKLDAKTHYNYSTPTTVFIEEGSLDNSSTIRGNQSSKNVLKKLTKNGYIE